MQGGSTLRSGGPQAWSSERQKLPVWGLLSVPDSGFPGPEGTESGQFCTSLGPVFLRREVAGEGRADSASGWGNSESAESGDELNDYRFLAATLSPPRSPRPARRVRFVVRQPLPWTLDEQCPLLPVGATFPHCSPPFRGTTPLNTGAGSAETCWNAAPATVLGLGFLMSAKWANNPLR